MSYHRKKSVVVVRHEKFDKSRAIAGRTARCRCKFQYVSLIKFYNGML